MNRSGEIRIFQSEKIIKFENKVFYNYIYSETNIKLEQMPKMKSVSSAKKRFTLTATGKIKRKHAFKKSYFDQKSNQEKEI